MQKRIQDHGWKMPRSSMRGCQLSNAHVFYVYSTVVFHVLKLVSLFRKSIASTSSVCITHADIDECKVSNGGCHPQRKCINIPGSKRCGDCPAGMLKDGFTGCRGINLQCPASVRTDTGYWSDPTKWVQGQVPTVCARMRLLVA